ncbi:hypothetical protein CFC21_027226 [Triticum aestivum]|uniref:Uncharacterized protein n=2 Tax=Triticum aestivum TaxID=4565 RepID=A0A3B6D7U5_WHEAT|nr:hypothetical protein CFC21_027226 [Triticum aestivum]
MASTSVHKTMAAMFLLVLTLGHLMAAADASLHHQDARRLLVEHNNLPVKLGHSEAVRVAVGPQEQPGTTAVPTNADKEALCPCWPAMLLANGQRMLMFN